MKLGLYVHIPFCRKKCDYCSFYSIPLSPHGKKTLGFDLENYIDILISEIKERSCEFKDYTVDTIYIGGGTPSLMTPGQLNKILDTVYAVFNIDHNPEITVEYNPDDFSVKKIRDYVNIGVNRIVLGVQSMNTKLHSVLGRSAGICGSEMLSEFAGIPDLSHCVDFIIGIPGQTRPDLEFELKEITNYKFEHISAYTLTIEQNTPLQKRYVPSQDFSEIQMHHLVNTIKFLTKAGYSHYEVSNYALPGFESKHNLKYWKFLPYAGFGPGAHSFYNGHRYYNFNSIEEYVARKGKILIKDERTRNSEIVEYTMSGLRLTEGISLNDFKEKLGFGIPENLYSKIIQLNKKQLLDVKKSGKDTFIKFTGKGFYQMDGLIYEIVEMYL